MVISSTEFFDAIRSYNVEKLLTWIHNDVYVRYPVQTEWSLDDDVYTIQNRSNPAHIIDYIGFGTTKGGVGGFFTLFNKPKSSVKALFYKKSIGSCVTFDQLKNLYSTYFVLLRYGGATISTENEINIPGCTIPPDVKKALLHIDNYFTYKRRDKKNQYQNALGPYIRFLNGSTLDQANDKLKRLDQANEKLRRYLIQKPFMIYIETNGNVRQLEISLKGLVENPSKDLFNLHTRGYVGGFRRSRKSRTSRKTRKSLHRL
jgi:hypothetical protein